MNHRVRDYGMLFAGLGFLSATTLALRASAFSPPKLGFSAHPYAKFDYTEPLSRGLSYYRSDVNDVYALLHHPTYQSVINQVDEYISVYSNGGIQIGLFGGQEIARWAYDTTNGANTNWGLADLESMLPAMLQVLPNIHVWEFGNEINWIHNATNMNFAGYWNPTAVLGTTVSAIPQNYVDTLKIVYQTIHGMAGHTNDIIIGGGTLSILGGSWSAQYPYGWQTMVNSPAYAVKIAQAGAGQWMDALGLHLYSDGVYLLSENPIDQVTGYLSPYNWGQIFQYGLSNHAAIYSGFPIYITEAGIISSSAGAQNSNFVYPPWLPPPSEARQATFAQQVATFYANSSPRPKVVCWYDLVESPFACASDKGDFGGYVCGTSTPKQMIVPWQAFNG